MGEIGRVYRASNWYGEVPGPTAFDHPWQLIPLQTADFVALQIRADFEHIEYDQLTLANIGPTIALQNATAFNGMDVGGGFDARALQATVERFKKIEEI
jgi:hypothetical protein